MADDRGLNLAVQRNRGDGVFHAGHHEEFELHIVRREAQRPQAFRQTVRSRCRGIVGEQHGVELLPFGLRHQLLVGQRRRRVEKPCTVAIFTQQAHGKRYLFSEPHRRKNLEVSTESRQIRRTGIQPVPLVGAEAVHQALHPGDLVGFVQPGQVDLGEVTARVVEQVPGVNACVRRVGDRRQCGYPKAAGPSRV